MTKEAKKEENGDDGDPWRNAMTSFFGISGFQDKEVEPEAAEDILVEIVGATQLSSQHGKDVDPYCCVCLSTNQTKLLHKTAVIQNDPDPIWTVQTGALCVVRVPTEAEGYVQVEVNHGRTCLGVVAVPFETVLKQKGERREYPIRTTTSTESVDDDIKGHLALRFRKAKPSDSEFLQNPTKSATPVADSSKKALFEMHKHYSGDINFHLVQNKSFTQTYKKTDRKTKKTLLRVQPTPDPERPDETTWLTKEEIHDAAWAPSRNWVEAGGGSVATVHIEVLGCDNLANTEVGAAVGDMTDPFVAICLEDSMLRTDVLHDTLNPRWMPWSTRAFSIHVMHPTSYLMLGVFDYDNAPLDDHDPVGRVSIHLENFQENTVYTLQYQLHDDVQQTDTDRGTIWLRLRVEWYPKQLLLVNKTPAPRFLINVESQKALHVVRYVCRGKTNVTTATLESTKIYAKEFMGYLRLYCFFLDVCMEIWLWRGRLIMFGGKVDLWFPLQSVVVLTAACLAVEYPHLIPTIFLYSIAWALLVVNFYNSNHPSPWHRCKSFLSLDWTYWTGRHIHTSGVTIEPEQGAEEAKQLAKLDEKKGERVAQFLGDTKTAALKTYRIYKKTSVEKYAIQTEDKEWSILGDSLYSIHMALYYLCTYLAMLRNLINWRPAGFGTHALTLNCLIGGFVWMVTPMYVWRWVARVLVWVVLGPQIKLVDVFYGKSYKTKQQLMETTRSFSLERTVSTFVDDVLGSQTLRKMGASGRIAAEESLKLQAMREVKFGKWSQLIPKLDTSRMPDLPLSASYAEPYQEEKHAQDNSQIQWVYVAGQKLKGNMIHEQIIQQENFTAVEDPSKRKSSIFKSSRK